jgi:carboxypeptidase C (cathepsin A)
VRLAPAYAGCEAGHMMYIHLPALAQMKQDLTEFIQMAK